MTFPVRRGRYGLRRLEPFAGLPGFEGLYDQMSRMLTSAFPDVARININSWSPPVDVSETDQAFVVEADVPGVAPDDVHVDLEGRDLRITGEYGSVDQPQAGESGEQQGQQQGQQRPRRTGRFDYRVSLPGEVRSEETTANLEHGVLRLNLPKVSSGARQRIQVQTSGSGPSSIETGPAGGESSSG